MTSGRHGARSSAAASPLWRIAVAAVLGVVAAGVVALLRWAQLPVDVAPMEVSSGGVGVVLGILLGSVPGALIGALGLASPAGGVARGLVVGLLWWAAWSLTLLQVLAGNGPDWGSAAVSRAFPDLVAALLIGSATGLLWAAVGAWIPGRLVGADQSAEDGRPRDQPRIVVLGGGFAGVAVAQRLERLAGRRARWDVTMVSDSNFLLFTPLLPGVAGGALEPGHVAAPLRAALPRTRFVLGRADDVDLDERVVRLGAQTLPFDHLVLALGAEPTFRDLPGIREHCLTLKSLRDAARTREHLLSQLERADLLPDGPERTRLLTVTVVGGGFAGIELAAELRDLAHSVLRYYPTLEPAQLRFVVVHSGSRILPELGPELAAFAAARLRASGLEIVLDTRVRGATETALLLQGAADVESATMVWTAGNQPSALVRGLEVEHARGGGVVVDDMLRAVGARDVWAAGDCAAVPDGSGGQHPPTAQHALREARALADNLAAVLDGREPRPFRFATIATLAALGHRTGVADVRGWRFSGVLAWGLWRVTYLSKLPGLEKRVRVALDWLVELGFPRDIVLPQESAEAPSPVTTATGGRR